MMNNKIISIIIKIIIIFVLIIGGFFAFKLFSNAGETGEQSQKNEQAIKYLDTKIISIINSLNNIQLQNYKLTLTKVEAKGNSTKNEQSSNEKEETNSSSNKEETEISKLEEETITTNQKEPEWDTIEAELKMIYSTWPSIVLDLYNTDINRDDILIFSSTLDDAVINVKNRDKTLSAMYIAKLYNFLPQYIGKNSEDEIKKKSIETKSYIINAYAYAETKNFEKMLSEIQKAEAIFTGLVNDARFVSDNRKYNINKTYILIEELKKSLDTKDTDIFYAKYKNTLEELNILS